MAERLSSTPVGTASHRGSSPEDSGSNTRIAVAPAQGLAGDTPGAARQRPAAHHNSSRADPSPKGLATKTPALPHERQRILLRM